MSHTDAGGTSVEKLSPTVGIRFVRRYVRKWNVLYTANGSSAG